MRKHIIGVMGPGDGATESDRAEARELGKAIASRGWVLLTGGRNIGVMEAVNQGAKEAGGLTIGILPDNDASHLSDCIDLPIFTDLGNARNNINVLSSDVVVACGMGLGTASEVALALKNGKSVVLLNVDIITQDFFQKFAINIAVAQTAAEAIEIVEALIEPQ
ncbi:cytochrome [Baaleninema sp.]|uniref:SLOG cluster 4 domain-containing protein n=1 Tax=Baaleninema sp. TaxID=3101197 RepID=UPI003D01F3E8